MDVKKFNTTIKSACIFHVHTFRNFLYEFQQYEFDQAFFLLLEPFTASKANFAMSATPAIAIFILQIHSLMVLMPAKLRKSRLFLSSVTL